MATIFTVNYSGDYGSKYELKIDASESDVSISGNTSKVTANAYVRRTDSSSNGAYNNNGTAWSITIDGTTTSGTSTWDTRNTTAWQFLGAASKTITHNSNGDKSITISGSHTGNSASGSSKMGNASGSGSFTLTTIPRYATANQSLKSKTSFSITMNWSSDNTIDYIWYSKDNGTTWTGVDVIDGTSGSYTISSLSANTMYKIKTRVRRKDSQLTTDSSALSVTTYAKTTPTISLSSKTVNSITVSSGCNVAVSSTQYRIKKSTGSYGTYQTSATFSGLSPNTAYVIEVKKVGSASGESGITTLSVTTYNYATLSVANDFNLGDLETIAYSNPSESAIAVGIYDSEDNVPLCAYRTANGSSYTFNFTDTELDNFYKLFKKGNTLSVRIYIRTTCNGTHYYNYKTAIITLTGNQKTIYIGKNGAKRGKVFIGKNGVKRCVIWIGIDKTARRCI